LWACRERPGWDRSAPLSLSTGRMGAPLDRGRRGRPPGTGIPRASRRRRRAPAA
jgi:hypothetical protein